MCSVICPAGHSQAPTQELETKEISVKKDGDARGILEDAIYCGIV